ncbi:hypothetical protein KEJ15_06440 [Candidatus Bathyarchaeota archaeon]|nr:hypothetical protein [Candidatus Bathyarchaeota archaeon]
MYVVWLYVDETLPWIELKGTYETRKEALDAARKFRSRIRTKIFKVKQGKKTLKAAPILKVR